MKFSIITPSFNQMDYLKRCIASVRDQVSDDALNVSACGGSAIGRKNVEVPGGSLNDLNDLNEGEGRLNATVPVAVHHHIQDGGSTDGTIEFLQKFDAEVRHQQSDVSADLRPPPSDLCPAYTFSYSSERDAGMYDAINKGVALVSGGQRSEDRSQRQMEPPVDIDFSKNHSLITNNCDDTVVAWLNCDEQYLPGTLQNVARYFSEHPETDLVCGDALLVAADGRLITYRKNPPLRKTYILADHLYAQSAALFFHAGVFTSGLQFDPSWKAVGDCDFVVRALSAGFRPGQIRGYLAACTMTGGNLSRTERGVSELHAFRRGAAPQYRIGRPVWNLLRCLEKFLRGGYHQSVPLEYELYPENSNVRKKFVVQHADFRFRWDGHE